MVDAYPLDRPTVRDIMGAIQEDIPSGLDYFIECLRSPRAQISVTMSSNFPSLFVTAATRRLAMRTPDCQAPFFIDEIAGTVRALDHAIAILHKDIRWFARQRSRRRRAGGEPQVSWRTH